MPNLRKKSAKSSTGNSSSGSQKTNMNQVGLIVIVIGVIIAALFAWHAMKNSNNTSTSGSSMNNSATSNDSGTPASSPVATLSVSPPDGNVSAGSDFKVQVWVDSKSDPVNAVQANLTYPADKFDFVKVDATGSAFGVAAPSHGGGGSVSIARGTIKPVTGKQLLAAFVLKPRASSGTVQINFAKGSAVDRSTDNKNTLQTTDGGSYTLTP